MLQWSYIKNIFLLSGGSLLGQVFPIVAAPFVLRLYGEVQYGELGLYMSITAVLTVIVGLQLHQNIITSRDKDDAIFFLRVANTASLVLSIFLLILLVLLDRLLEIFGYPSLASVFYLLPLGILCACHTESMISFANKEARFSLIASAKLFTGIMIPCLSLLFGFIGMAINGLIIAYIGGQILSFFYCSYRLHFYGYLGINDFLLAVRRPDTRELVIGMLPSELSGVVVRNLPVFFLQNTYGLAAVGFYNFSHRMLGSPAMILGNAIRTLFKKDGMDSYLSTGNFKVIYMRTFFVLSSLSFCIYISVTFFAEPLVELFFGPRWLPSIAYMKVLVYLYVLQLLASPLSYSLIIRRRFNLQRSISITSLLLILCGFISSIYLGLGVLDMLKIYAYTRSAVYIYMIVVSFRFSI